MAKLPEKLVQAPTFDSPLRRTSPELTLIDEPDPPTVIVDVALTDNTPPGPGAAAGHADPLPHRVTVRLSQRQWEAVQTACYRERLAGKRVNAASLLRDIVDRWILSS